MLAQSFEDLLVWQKAHKYVLNIYRVTKGFPKEEMFGLVNQMRCASTSITANIAEGFVRVGQKDKLQHITRLIGGNKKLRYSFQRPGIYFRRR